MTHARFGPQRAGSGAVVGRRARGGIGPMVLWHTTKPRPWQERKNRRARNRRARASRKVNR